MLDPISFPSPPRSNDETARTVAAVDLGSNSFHMLIARSDGGPFEILDRMRERVRIAGGLDGEGYLSEEAQERAFACLARFGQRLREFSSNEVRAVGTNTFRSARNAKKFRRRAEAALGHRIEIISGGEEARLIHLGVRSQQVHPEGRWLIVDIGGGSTELIVAEGDTHLAVESVPLGCVTQTRAHFKKGKLTEKAFRAANLAARIELRPIEQRFRAQGWSLALGSAGTVHAIQRLVRETGDPNEPITRAGLRRVRDLLVESRTVDAITLPGLSDDRRPVIAGGLAVLLAVFKALKIGELTAAPGGLREGILADLVGRISQADIREEALARFLDRYGVDRAQALRVERTALSLFDAIAPTWELSADARQILSFAARLHEVGLAISHQAHHKHAEYLIRNSDMAGFSTDDQEAVAALVRSHRRRVSRKRFESLSHFGDEVGLRLLALLRFAVALHRTRSDRSALPVEPRANGGTLELVFPQGFFDAHPLTREELRREIDTAHDGGVKIAVVVQDGAESGKGGKSASKDLKEKKENVRDPS